MRRLALVGATLATLALLAVTVGGSALAYFATSGSGTASAAVSKLTAPTLTATAAAGGTVSLSWGAVTAPGSGTVTYYVTRDGGDPAGTCPLEAAPAAVTSCKDSGVAIGEHTYRVTAVWKGWTVASAAKTANVTIGEAIKFTIAGTPTTPVTGGSVNLTITAKDVNNATVTTYTGSHSLVFSGASPSPGGTAATVANSSGTAVNFGTATPLAFTLGVAAITSSTKNGVLKIFKAGAASITATEGTLTTPTPLALTVSPSATTKFVLVATSATPGAGVGDGLTITAQDAYNNTATGYSGSHSLVFSAAVSATSPNGTLPTVSDSGGADVAFGTATAIAFDAGVSSAAEGDGGTMAIYKAGASTVKATEGSVLTPTGVTVTVSPGTATKLALTSSTPTPTAASNFNLTTTAQDLYGNTATSYAGAKNVTFSGASPSPSGALPTVVNSAGTVVNFGSPTALTFTLGVAAVSASKNGYAKLNKAGATNVSATDGTLTTATALALTVNAAAASRLAITEAVVSAGAVGSPCLFTCAITALGNSGTVKADVSITDSVGNTVSNVGTAKTVAVSVTAGGTIAGSPLTVPAAGLAVTETEFTYTAPASGAFTHTITMASTGYTSATATVSK